MADKLVCVDEVGDLAGALRIAMLDASRSVLDAHGIDGAYYEVSATLRPLCADFAPLPTIALFDTGDSVCQYCGARAYGRARVGQQTVTVCARCHGLILGAGGEQS